MEPMNPETDPMAGAPEVDAETATTAKRSITIDLNDDGTFTVTSTGEGEAVAPENFQSIEEVISKITTELGQEKEAPTEEVAPAEEEAPAEKPNAMRDFMTPR